MTKNFPLLFLLFGLSFGHPQLEKAVGGAEFGALPTTCGHPSYDCVPFFQCKDGVIITDGGGLIDPRIQPTAGCVNPEYPDVSAVCCLIPGKKPTPAPSQLCPIPQECVNIKQCGADGFIKTDGSGIIDPRKGFKQCNLPDKSLGVCCSPPPDDIQCPPGSFCLSHDKCTGKGLTIGENFLDFVPTGTWASCIWDGNNNGVCCQQPKSPHVATCPGDSRCIIPNNCVGKAMDNYFNFVDYVQTGSWSYCGAGAVGANLCCLGPASPILKPSNECGIRNYNLNTRIQSNLLKNEANFGEFPWQAIIFQESYRFKCGATLISNKHLVTAAHCVYGDIPANMKIRLGEWQVNKFDEKLPYVDSNVIAIIIHPEYKHESKNFYNDIAIMELEKPIELQYHINTVCIPEKTTKVPPGTRCYASGWGKDAFSGTYQEILRSIDVPIIGNGQCQNWLRETRLGKHFKLHNSFVCAGGEANKDACKGDGGGPLVCKNNAGKYELIGITAWGIDCGLEKVPGVYVDVAKFSDWIFRTVHGKGPGKQTAPIPGYGK